MRTVLAIALAGAAFFPGISGAVAEPKSLAEVEEFAFGGVGVAGIESQGERFFRDLMGRDDAVVAFKKILGSGTRAAKLYALCGIRLLSQKDFDAAAEPLLKSNETVTTIGGCMISKRRVAEVARQISLGSFDISLKNPPRWR
jgi:lipoate-protein ligase A